jgi:hypothetical protein
MRTCCLALLATIACATLASPAPPDSVGIEFFEQKVRPVLVQHCYECHSAATRKPKGGLLLDSREATRKGGESGPALVPGAPEKSLLIKAVRYDGLEMPPKHKGKLADKVVADLEHWVKIGAPDPRDKAATQTVTSSWEKVLEERRQWWSLQPVRKPAIPAAQPGDSAHPVDRFLLAELRKRALEPAAHADRRTLIRRLSLVLTGLLPTPAEIEAFVNEPAPNAYEQLVDRLLASPHFGERWAQHWLDIVRFSETNGNEWNYDVPHAWRYRDYLIRAFNQDIPLDQLIREHIAGDLLAKPRWNRQENFNESVIGTAFYRFGDGNVEDCVAVPLVGFDVVDNEIDTLSKAFQATTAACARCHDHKLDAVSMKDYYGLVGILHSSRKVSHTIDAPEANAQTMARLRGLKAEIRAELAEIWLREATDLGRYLLAADVPQAINAAAPAPGLVRERLERWQAALKLAKAPAEDVLSPWRALRAAGAEPFSEAWRKQALRFADDARERTDFNRQFRALADFRDGPPPGWQIAGQGLRDGSARAGDFSVATEGEELLSSLLPAGCFTHTLSDRLNGAVRSPPLPRAAGKRLSIEVMGQHASAVRLVTHNCQLNTTHYQSLAADALEWLTFQLPEDPTAYHIYVELMTKFDNPKFPDPVEKASRKDKENYRVPWDIAAANPRSSFGVTRIVLHDDKETPRPELSHLRPLFAGPPPASRQEWAVRYAATTKAAVQAWADNRASDDDVRWLEWLRRHDLLGNEVYLSPRLAELARQYRAAEKELAQPRIVFGVGDYGAGYEQPLFARGDCLRPADKVPRGYLEVLAKSGERFTPSGSGRLQLAERIARTDNPLTARVMVNRVWQHVFGEGLVRTVDDFGHNGERPSHPELLDYLAGRFVEDGWSVKRMIRTLVLTDTFQLSDRPGETARAADPENRLLHHYRPRRMEAETIRDAILASSGRLDRTLYGPSVEPYREREIDYQRLFAGPLDGNGRRSLYIKNTLMERPKFLSAFNYPKGCVMQGRRDVTNVPAQALALLNDPFVLQQADVWAERLVSRSDPSVAARLEHMFQVALGRSPTKDEHGRFEKAVQQLAALHGVSEQGILKSREVWKDVAHTIFNLKEFIYIP